MIMAMPWPPPAHRLQPGLSPMIWATGGDAGGDHPGQWREPVVCGLGVAHDDHGGGAVVEGAAVAGGAFGVGVDPLLVAGGVRGVLDLLLGDPEPGDVAETLTPSPFQHRDHREDSHGVLRIGVLRGQARKRASGKRCTGQSHYNITDTDIGINSRREKKTAYAQARCQAGQKE
jgi:hypothetical protein